MSSAERKPTDGTAAASSSAAKQPAAAASSSSTTEEKEEKIVLRSSDGEEFTVDVPVARQCSMISNMIDDECVDGTLVLPDIKSHVLARVLEYLHEKHKHAAGKGFKDFEVEFFKRLADKEALFDVILAANYLHAPDLLDAAFYCVADRIRGKSVEELRQYFDITNDFTPEEEAEIRKENLWAFD